MNEIDEKKTDKGGNSSGERQDERREERREYRRDERKDRYGGHMRGGYKGERRERVEKRESEGRDEIRIDIKDEEIADTETVREIVVPGDLLDGEELRAGVGTYKDDDGKIYASQLGIKNTRANYVNVIPLAGRYMPRAGDSVIGKVVDIGPSNWLIDINAPYPAPLHVSETPWKVEFGDTGRYLGLGDMVLIRVVNVDETKHVQVSMSGPGLRKLVGGHIIEISHSKVPRVIGKGGSMISLIKKYTKCRMFVGQNGRIWIDGEPEEIYLASRAIEKIENEAHVIGLTDAMDKYLSEEVKKIRGKVVTEEVEEKESEEDSENLVEEHEEESDESGREEREE